MQDNVGQWYFDRDTVLDDYGCYRLDLIVSQSGPDAAGGTGYTMPPTYYMFEEHTQPGDPPNNPDTNWESFELVSSC